ncbi:MAG: hypothetical protein HQ537_02595 [Parcubacteria group bacterium]|nr:hypothetical protein [Parcubacteria group bacterium]
MPNGRSHKSYDDYGPHAYADHDGTSDCEYRCGCWAGPARSGGPIGISPFGHCPNNPLDGQKQSNNNDYEDCVNGRIQKLESELYEAKQSVDVVERVRKGTKVDLIKRLDQAENRITNLEGILKGIRDNAERIQESASVITRKET